MPFPRKLLNDNEEVVVDIRPHPVTMAKPSLALIAAVGGAIWVSANTDNDPLLLAVLVLVLVTLVWFLVRFAKWVTTNLVVTNDRLIVRSGVIAKRAREIPLERINDITVTQSLFMRMLGAGDLVIESAGERGQQVFPGCPDPGRVQNEIYRQMELAADRDHQRRQSGRDLHPLDQLERLDELRRRGVISQAEFDAKKTHLLGRL